jgi:hypothetical protein
MQEEPWIVCSRLSMTDSADYALVDAAFAKSFLPEPLRPTSSRVIINSLDRAITTPACLIAWLLCAVLVCLVVHPPHCDLCDGPLGISSSPQTVVNQQQSNTPEHCNGICWCCGFDGLPNASPDLDPVNTVTSNVRPERLSPVFAPHSDIFRPPPTNVSS